MSAATGEGRTRPALGRLVGVPARAGPPSTPATDLVGVDLAGAPLAVPVAAATRRTLLLFLLFVTWGAHAADLSFASLSAAAAQLGNARSLVLVLALSYGGRQEIVDACRDVEGGTKVGNVVFRVRDE